jgi:hypothetical protein
MSVSIVSLKTYNFRSNLLQSIDFRFISYQISIYLAALPCFVKTSSQNGFPKYL